MRRQTSGVTRQRPRARAWSVLGALAALLVAAPLAAQKQPAASGNTQIGTSKSATAARQLPGAQDTDARRPTPDARPGSGCPASSERSICFSRIDAEYNVLRSGDVMVTERFTVRFNGDWNGMTRELIQRATSHDYRSAEECRARPPSGYRDVDIDVEGAVNHNGEALQIDEESTSDGVNLRIWVPGARDAERIVVLRYRIQEGVTFICGHDEFYWNVLGATSTAPVQHMTVRVIPPEGIAGLRADAFAGAEGSEERNATFNADSGFVSAATTAPLGAGLGFTVVAGWDSGVVEQPSAFDRFLEWLARYWSLILPPVAFGLMWSRWRSRGRDPAMLPIVTQYDVPEGITPGEVGTLLDERADMRDVTATLVDLAVQGRLRIDETEGTKVFGMEFGESFRFVQTAPDIQTPPAKNHEAKLLSALFDGRSQVELEDLKNEFYKDLPGIREAMMECLVSRGVYTKRPDRARAAWVVGGIMLGVALFFLLGFLGTSSALALVLVPPLTALPVIVFGWLMPARTTAGTRLIEKLRGFREFLERVDGDRLRRMKIAPDAFEKMLPFAMALGVEKKWGEAFDGLAQEPPRWYHTRHGRPFRPAVFVGDLGRMSTATASTMASQPRSSGSGGSGFGGGGSVGGGGGGGGVGGF